jgi:DNA-binding transcriptional MerR regulator
MNAEYFSSINDVSARLDVPAHTLRYWEKQFPAAIKPTTGAGGRRYYRPETVDMLIKIKELLYVRGMTINGVKKLLKDGEMPQDLPAPKPAAMTEQKKTTIDEAVSMLEDARVLLS